MSQNPDDVSTSKFKYILMAVAYIVLIAAVTYLGYYRG